MASDKVNYLKVDMAAVRLVGWDVAICYAYIAFRRKKDLRWLPSEAKLVADLCGEGYKIPTHAIRKACQIFKKKYGINQRMRRMPYAQAEAIRAQMNSKNART